MPLSRYISLWDFDGHGTDQLSFKAGDRFQAVHCSGEWWLVEKINAAGEKTGQKGYVPYNYMEEEKTAEEQSYDQEPGVSDKYIVVKDFQDIEDDEICIKAKERVQVLYIEEDRWLVSKVEETEEDPIIGYVPWDTLVKEKPVEEQSWFIDTDGAGAETLLLTDPNIDGSFLVRPNKDSVYCLSVRNNKTITHYSIDRRDMGKFFINNERSFTCVHDLVLHYKHHLDHPCLPLIPVIKVTKDPEHKEDLKDQEDPWELPASDFTLEKELNVFNICDFNISLWNGSWIKGKRKVIIQTISKEYFEKENLMEGIEILKKLNHKHITELYALCTTEDPVYIVTEFMERGDLLRYLREDGTLLKEPDLLHIAHQVADGMAYLEEKGVLHLNLTCRSILVAEHLVCKISQFQLAVRERKGHPYSLGTRAMPMHWMPPEVLKEAKFSTKTDVWSFGVVLYEIFTFRETPYRGSRTSKEVLGEVTKGHRLPKPPLCSSDLYILMLRCWHEDKDSRPSFQEIVESDLL